MPKIPQYSAQITDAVATAGTALQNLGVQQDQINAVVNAIDPGQLVDLAMSILSSTLGVLSNLFFLLTVLLFMAFDTDTTRRALGTLRDRYPNPYSRSSPTSFPTSASSSASSRRHSSHCWTVAPGS
jgi:predicted PurR-regulated permease PerM